MRKYLIASVSAATLLSSVFVPPSQALAGDGFGAGLVGGLVAGTILGAAAGGPRYYAPAPVYVEPAPIYVNPNCYWRQRSQPVWDDYRGIWVRPRVRVCE